MFSLSLRFQLFIITAVCLLFILAGTQPLPYIIGLLAIMTAMTSVKSRGFVMSFSPFFLLLLGYFSLKMMADDFSFADVTITEIIRLEKTLFFGYIPSALLQQAIPSGVRSVVVAICDALYLSHFVVPVIVGIILWHVRRDMFKRYMTGLVVLSYAGFLLFVLFPVAPPWWATYYGYLSGDEAVPLISRVPVDVMISSPNPVAAMPSLHAAYSMYVAVSVVLVWGRAKRWVFLYPLAVAFAVVYLGHHYVVDVLAGWGMVGIVDKSMYFCKIRIWEFTKRGK